MRLVGREGAEPIAAFHPPPGMLGVRFLVLAETLPLRDVGRADGGEVVGYSSQIPPRVNAGRKVQRAAG